MEGAGTCKRSRDESADFPEAKRLREADLIFDILDDEDGAVDESVGDLADVIKRLEEEIAAPSPPPELDLGYLLEASDDELGLPPAVGSSPYSSCEVADEGTETAGFDRIWGFEDEGLEFVMPTEFDDSVIFDGGLFEYSDAGEFTWPLTAV